MADRHSPAVSSASPGRAGRAALSRWGGMLWRPRAHAAELAAAEGPRDGLWLGLLYLVGTSVYALVAGLADALAVRNLGGLIMFGSTLARALVVPILVLVAGEAVLGAERSHRRGLGLLPLVILGTAAHTLRQLGIATPGPSWLPDAVGGVLGVALVWWIRDAVAPRTEAA